MKPTRNRVYCIGCDREKMLFESEAKADNFIKFNSEEIRDSRGKAPVRSYYCDFCKGWHVTSNPSREAGESINRRDEALMGDLLEWGESQEELGSMKKEISAKCLEAERRLAMGWEEGIESIIEWCEAELEQMKQHKYNLSRVTQARGKIAKTRQKLEETRALKALTEAEKEALMNIAGPTKEQRRQIRFLQNWQVFLALESLRQRLEECKAKGDRIGVSECWQEARRKVGELTEPSAKKGGEMYIEMLHEIKSKKIEKEQPKEAPKKPAAKKPKVNADFYKQAILDLISKLELIKKNFEDGQLDSCEDNIAICEFLLEELGVKDENTQLIENQLNIWKEKIESV